MPRIEGGDLSKLLSIKDQIGGKIDVMILPAVEGLNALGFATHYSCQGHLRTSEVDANTKYPFVMVDVGDGVLADKQRLRLTKLADFYNKRVPEYMRVEVEHVETVGLSTVNFGQNREGKKGVGRRLLNSQTDAVTFATFCRALSLGKEETLNAIELIILMPLKEFDYPEYYPRLIYEAHKSFEADYYELMQVLRPSSLTFQLMQEGMGL